MSDMIKYDPFCIDYAASEGESINNAILFFDSHLIYWYFLLHFEWELTFIITANYHT